MAEHKESRAKSAMSGKKSSTKRTGRKVKEMHIRPGKSGGYVIKHDLEPRSKQEEMDAMINGGSESNTEEHVAPDLAALHQHIDQNLPEENEQSNVVPDTGEQPTSGGM